MGRRCMVEGCGANKRSNKNGQSYTKMVSTWNEESKEKWIKSMPNDPEKLKKIEKIWVCVNHFEGPWKKVQGGNNPVNPPTKFELYENSPRSTENRKLATDRRSKSEEQLDKIKNFETFCTDVKVRNKDFNFVRDGDNFSMYLTDKMGRQVVRFILFSKAEIETNFGFLKLVTAEVNGMEVPKQDLGLPKIV